MSTCRYHRRRCADHSDERRKAPRLPLREEHNHVSFPINSTPSSIITGRDTPSRTHSNTRHRPRLLLTTPTSKGILGIHHIRVHARESSASANSCRSERQSTLNNVIHASEGHCKPANSTMFLWLLACYFSLSHVATQAERIECEQLHEQRSPTNTFMADDTKIPATTKMTKDPAPTVAAITQDQNARLAGAGIVGAGTNAPEAPATEGRIQSPTSSQTQTRVGATGPQVGPTQADTRVNTTRFDYMPLSMKETHSVLPPLNGEPDTAQKKRSLLEAKLGDPDREGKRWRGAHFLGAGATGNCTLWVQTDENENIEEVSDARLVLTIHGSLTNAISDSLSETSYQCINKIGLIPRIGGTDFLVRLP